MLIDELVQELAPMWLQSQDCEKQVYGRRAQLACGGG